MNKDELLIRLADIEWDDFEVKEARSELPKNIWETVSAFANSAGGWIVLGVSQKGKKYEICGVEKPEKLEKLQITDGECLTYGGLLFLGKNLAINKSFPDFRVDLLEIPGRSYAEAEPRYTFRLEEQENLWEYYFAIVERLRRQIKNIPYKLDSWGVGIDDSSEYDAIREALVNLLMHCDYFSPMKPRVRVFTDRIEFENPGAFVRPISELLKKDVSIPRNPVIAKLFRNVKLADNAGYGFDKMLKWEKSTHNKVSFESSIDVALVTFKIDGILSDATENVTEKSREQKILEMIMANPKVSTTALAREFSVTRMTLHRDLEKLKTKGLLERVGPAKGGHWKVRNEKGRITHTL